MLWKTRQAHSKAIALTRKAARAELERATLHPDTMRVFARYEKEIYAPNAEMLILATDQWVRGEIDIKQFRALLAQAREYADPVRVLKPKRWKRKQPLLPPLLKPLLASKLLASTSKHKPTRQEAEPEYVELWWVDRSKEPSGF